MAIHIVDRRLNPGSKSLENRQRFLRRAKALVQRAVKNSSQSRDIRDVLQGGEVSLSPDGMDEEEYREQFFHAGSIICVSLLRSSGHFRM